MPDDPVGPLISAVFDVYNRSFVSGHIPQEMLERYWDPEIRHVTRFTALEGRAYVGYEGLRRFIEEVREQFERFDTDLERVLGEGDTRVAVYRVDALSRGAGIPIGQRLGMTVELRNGRICRTKVYADPREALAAAGIDEAEL